MHVADWHLSEGRGGGGDWMKKGEEISQWTYMHNLRQLCDDGQTELGWGLGDVGKEGGNGDIGNM